MMVLDPRAVYYFIPLFAVSLIWAEFCIAEETVFFVVRHAERANGSPNSPLSDAGAKRSQQLMQTLEHLKLAAIYTTDFDRTKDTAKPLAEKLGIKTEVYAEPSDAWLDRMMEAQKGKSVLVVAHSNTVHKIVNWLASQSIAELKENEFDNLFIVVVNGDQKSLVRLRYGAPTP